MGRIGAVTISCGHAGPWREAELPSHWQHVLGTARGGLAPSTGVSFTDSLRLPRQPWGRQPSTFRMWRTNRHSFPCSETPFTAGGGAIPRCLHTPAEAPPAVAPEAKSHGSAAHRAFTHSTWPGPDLWLLSRLRERRGHTTSFGFCNPCNPRTHPPLLISPTRALRESKPSHWARALGRHPRHRGQRAELTQPREQLSSVGLAVTTSTTARLLWLYPNLPHPSTPSHKLATKDRRTPLSSAPGGLRLLLSSSRSPRSRKRTLRAASQGLSRKRHLLRCTQGAFRLQAHRALPLRQCPTQASSSKPSRPGSPRAHHGSDGAWPWPIAQRLCLLLPPLP